MRETILFSETPVQADTKETPVNRAPGKCGCNHSERPGNTTVIFLDRVLITAFIIWLFVYLIKKIVE